MTFDAPHRRSDGYEPRPSRTAVWCRIAVLTLVLGCTLLPAPVSAPIERAWFAALEPGLRVLSGLAQRGQQLRADWLDRQATSETLAALRVRVAELERLNRRLLSQREGRTRPDATADVAARPLRPLLSPLLVEARLIGPLGRSFLARHSIIALDAATDLSPEALVLDASPAILDAGVDQGVGEDDLVFAAHHVVGKVRHAGRRCCRIARANEKGYRDVVYLAAADDPQRRHGRGVLEGTGDPLCRLRLVDVTQPAQQGDLVCAAAADGVIDTPLVYGQIVRLERQEGAAYWDIWVEPRVTTSASNRIVVLGAKLNDLRVAGEITSADRLRR